MKYKVKCLCSKGKNSPYTIRPGIYDASSEPQEVWDYLLKLGTNCIEVSAPSPCDLGNCSIPTPKPRKKKEELETIPNIEKEETTQNKENI